MSALLTQAAIAEAHVSVHYSGMRPRYFVNLLVSLRAKDDCLCAAMPLPEAERDLVEHEKGEP